MTDDTCSSSSINYALKRAVVDGNLNVRCRGRILVWALLVTCVRDRVLFYYDTFLKFRHLAVVSHKFARVAARAAFPPLNVAVVRTIDNLID
jgi:hypothetical protein